MNGKNHSKEQEAQFKIAFESPQKLDWIVREDPELQAELNDLSETSEEVSSQVVHKVLDRIKSL
jgi:hypothetical protein